MMNEIVQLERLLIGMISQDGAIHRRTFSHLDIKNILKRVNKIKTTIETLEDLCVGYCECCNSFYDNSEVAFCEECCVGCQGKEHDNIDYYCNDCREEIDGAVNEMNAIIRGDYI